MYTVYKHTAPSGKVYIGITGQKPDERWKNGKGYTDNEHFYRAIQKYGWENFKHEIIADALTKEQACTLEIRLIAKYDATNQDKGYNHSTGGESGHAGIHLSVETRRKLSEVNKGANHPNYGKHMSVETRRKISEANNGKRRSIEARRKMSEARKGWHMSAETLRKIHEKSKKSVVCVETGKQYASVNEASASIGVKACTVSAVLHGRGKTAGGYHWKYAERR